MRQPRQRKRRNLPREKANQTAPKTATEAAAAATAAKAKAAAAKTTAAAKAKETKAKEAQKPRLHEVERKAPPPSCNMPVTPISPWTLMTRSYPKGVSRRGPLCRAARPSCMNTPRMRRTQRRPKRLTPAREKGQPKTQGLTKATRRHAPDERASKDQDPTTPPSSSSQPDPTRTISTPPRSPRGDNEIQTSLPVKPIKTKNGDLELYCPQSITLEENVKQYSLSNVKQQLVPKPSAHQAHYTNRPKPPSTKIIDRKSVV